MNNKVDTHLGKKSEYKTSYDKNILVRETRKINREHIGIPDNYQWTGYDTWNAYEVSTLTKKGFPVTGIIKIVYSASSKYIVESKSLKLYLYSYNMYMIGSDYKDAVTKLLSQIETDLSKLLETRVNVGFFTPKNVMRHTFYNDTLLEEKINIDSIVFNQYKTDSNILNITLHDSGIGFKLYTSLLRSNCKITGQPDNGDVSVYYVTSSCKLVEESFLKYIVSFRNENHFHESIIEKIYYDLNKILKPKSLCVTGLYVRRGGIDINPQRASCEDLIDKELVNVYSPHIKTTRQ